MANVLVEETSLTAIANSIRGKNGTTNTYKPGEMPAAIDAIETGGGNAENFLVRRRPGSGTTTLYPAAVSAYEIGGREYYGSNGAYISRYYWYRSSNTNVYWKVCDFYKTHFTTGHKYRFSTWIWHDNSQNDNEEIEIWQNTIFFNSSTSVTCPLQKITKDPQLLQVEVDWTYVDDAYGAVVYLYPSDSSNQIRLTPIVVEDLTSPTTTGNVPMPL